MKAALASLDDIPRLMPIMLDGARKVGEPSYGVPMREGDIRRVLEETIKKGWVVFGDKSVAGAIAMPFIWNNSFNDVHILFWHFMRMKEIVILEELLLLLAGLGYSRAHVTSHFPKNTILKRYQRLGFHATEVVSTLTLNE